MASPVSARHPRAHFHQSANVISIGLLVLFGMAASFAHAQVPPTPWPQPGQTQAVQQPVDTAFAIDYGGTGPTPFSHPLEFVLPTVDTFWSSSTPPEIDSIVGPYHSWNSWDIPPGSRLAPSGQPSGQVYVRQNYPLTTCPPGSWNCTTGGGINGETWGALQLRIGLTPGVVLRLDTLHYDANVEVTMPTPGSFLPGDTITVGVDARLDSVATFVGALELDNAALELTPALQPFTARMGIRTCLLGECVSRVRQVPAQGDSLIGTPLTVSRNFDPAELGRRGLSGTIRLPQLAFSESRVENGRSITLSGEDAYGTLDWDLDHFLCGGCMSGSLSVLGASIRYTLLAMDLHTALRFRAAITLEPTIDVTLDFGPVQLEYVVRDPDGTVVESGTGSTVSFALGNSLGLVMSPAAASAAGPITVTPSIAIGLPKLDYAFRFISGPVRLGLTALSAHFDLPSASAGPFQFAGLEFPLGPAYNNRLVSDSARTKSLEGSLPLPLPPFVRSLDPIQLSQPQLPKVATTVGPAKPNVALPLPSSALLAGHAAPGGVPDDLVQTITVRNVGNVHLANLGLGYELSTTSGVVVAEGEILTGDYLEMLQPVDLQVPLEVASGSEYRLGVTVRAETPIGTATATPTEWTLGMYEMEIGVPDAGGGTAHLPVTLYSSAELDVRRIDPASVRLAGVAAADWSWNTVGGIEALVLRLPAAEVLAAARARISGTPTTIAPNALVQALVDLGQSLPAAQAEVADRQGNGNGRFDVGDVRAYLEATGELPASGAGSTGGPAGGAPTIPVMLLLSGVMDTDQPAYGMDILLLTQED